MTRIIVGLAAVYPMGYNLPTLTRPVGGEEPQR